jgi:hypothetical protein
VPRDERRERPGVGERIAAQQAEEERPDGEDVARRGRGVELAQRLVVRRPEECERRHQRAGGHAGDDLEHRAAAGLGPALQESRTERAVRTPARQREMRIPDEAVGAAHEVGGRLLPERQLEVPFHRRARPPGPGADVRKVGDRRFGRQLGRYRVADQRTAPGDRQGEADQREATREPARR